MACSRGRNEILQGVGCNSYLCSRRIGLIKVSKVQPTNGDSVLLAIVSEMILPFLVAIWRQTFTHRAPLWRSHSTSVDGTDSPRTSQFHTRTAIACSDDYLDKIRLSHPRFMTELSTSPNPIVARLSFPFSQKSLLFSYCGFSKRIDLGLFIHGLTAARLFTIRDWKALFLKRVNAAITEIFRVDNPFISTFERYNRVCAPDFLHGPNGL